MTKEKLRIICAELDGWTEINSKSWSGYTKQWNPLCSNSSEREGFYLGYVPNYHEDLNAVHELEKKLSPEQQIQYAILLWNITDAHGWGEGRGWFTVATATAPQRCEALARLHGKWEEGE